MNFSYELIQEYKKVAGLNSDYEACKVIPKITSGNLSQIKSGMRALTEEQTVWICSQCEMDLETALVKIAIDTAKTKEAKSAWSNLAKKLAANGLALVLIGFLSISSGYQVGKHVLLRRSRLFA